MMMLMNKNKEYRAAQVLLRRSNLTATDAARLTMECLEELGVYTETIPREQLMGLIRRCIREGASSIVKGEHTVSFAEAAWRSVDARAGRRPTTRRDLRHYVRRMLRVEGMAEKPLRKMTSSDCRRLLNQAFGNSPSSFRKGRAILHSIFAFGIRHEWIDANPSEKIESPGIKEKSISPLSLTQTRKLLRAAAHDEHREMQLSLHLMLYCGLRPTEVQRLSVSDIDWTHKQVIIRPCTSKTGGGRIVPLRCATLIPKTARQIPRNWYKRWKKLRRAAGFRRNWAPDVCRHTFASYHAAHFRNLEALQLEMGHRDSTLLRTRYVSVATRQQAQQFWDPVRMKKALEQ